MPSLVTLFTVLAIVNNGAHVHCTDVQSGCDSGAPFLPEPLPVPPDPDLDGSSPTLHNGRRGALWQQQTLLLSDQTWRSVFEASSATDIMDCLGRQSVLHHIRQPKGMRESKRSDALADAERLHTVSMLAKRRPVQEQAAHAVRLCEVRLRRMHADIASAGTLPLSNLTCYRLVPHAHACTLPHAGSSAEATELMLIVSMQLR